MARESHFHATWQSLGARFTDFCGWRVPEDFGDVRAEYKALRTGAGILDRCYRAHILVKGEDAVRFLQGMVSNDIKALAPGSGCYATLLNPQGQMLADLYAFTLADGFLIETAWDLKDKVWQTLDHYIIMDQVALEDRSEQTAAVAVEGQQASALIGALVGIESVPAGDLTFADTTLGGTALRVTKRTFAGSEAFELAFGRDAVATVGERLGALGTQFGARPVGLVALNIARVEAGIPWYGADMVESTLPPEAGLETTAISYTKGCYVGQEIVERIRSRGHVNRRLTGFFLDGVAKAGDKVLADEREVGHLTSIVESIALGRTIALGYLRREHIEPGKKFKTATATVEVAMLPFWKP